jgi:UDP-galactose transporter B1
MVANGSVRQRGTDGKVPEPVDGIVKASQQQAGITKTEDTKSGSNLTNLIICVSGIYAAFLTWGVLQERITTTNYGTEKHPEIFRFPVVVNTVQSLFAAILGWVYTNYTRTSKSDKPIFPSKKIFWPLALVSLTSSLSSPFGYASLAHVDYITFILAKSCKLLPVMFLHVTLYRRKYPFYKYAVVALVTAGVAIFTLHQPAGSKKKGNQSGNSTYGLVLLGINLLFDGLTNSTQDDINATFKPYSGQQMMCALNTMQTLITSLFLLLSPYIALTGLGSYVGMGNNAGELYGALAFYEKHPAILYDVLGFAVCGAVGQLFICKFKHYFFSCQYVTNANPISPVYTLSIFGSLFLVTVTVTRKMLTMIISVVWFGHSLGGMQWVGVACVFGGIGIEAELGKREKAAKEKARQVEAEKRAA